MDLSTNHQTNKDSKIALCEIDSPECMEDDVLADQLGQITFSDLPIRPNTTITDLPNELISDIFLYLVAQFDANGGLVLSTRWIRVTQVCKRFHSIVSQSAQLWSYVNLDWPEEVVFRYLARANKSLFNLCAVLAAPCADVSLKPIISQVFGRPYNIPCAMWESLTLEVKTCGQMALGTELSEGDFDIEDGVPHLRSIHLTGDNMYYINLNRCFFGISNFPRLTMLHLDRVHLKECPQLLELELLSLRYLKLESLKYLWKLFQGTPRLNTLSIDCLIYVGFISPHSQAPPIPLPLLNTMHLKLNWEYLLRMLEHIPSPRTQLVIEDPSYAPHIVASMIPQIGEALISSMKVVPSISWSFPLSPLQDWFEYIQSSSMLAPLRFDTLKKLSLDHISFSKTDGYPLLPALEILNLKDVTMMDSLIPLFALLQGTESLRMLLINRIKASERCENHAPWVSLLHEDALNLSRLTTINIRASSSIIEKILHRMPVTLYVVALHELETNARGTSSDPEGAFDVILNYLSRLWDAHARGSRYLSWTLHDYALTPARRSGVTFSFDPRDVSIWDARIYTETDSDLTSPKTMLLTRSMVSEPDHIRGSLRSLTVHITKLLGTSGRKSLLSLLENGLSNLQHVAIYGTTTEYDFDQEGARFLRSWLISLKEMIGMPLFLLEWEDLGAITSQLRPTLQALVDDALVLELSMDWDAPCVDG